MKAQQEFMIDEIVGVVGDKIVLYSDIEQQYQQSLAQGAPVADLRCSVIDNMLLQKLLVNQAVLDSLVVTEQEVESELDNRFNYYIRLVGSEEKFEEFYGKNVLEFKQEFRPQVRELLLAQNMRREIVQEIVVRPNDVKEFFANIPADSLPYFAAEAEISHIVMKPEVSPAEKEKAIQKLEDLRKQIVDEGADFAELAKMNSQDGSALNGGSLGFMKRGELVPEFEAAAYRLKPGEVSEVVESQFGLHLILLEERLGNRINTRHILIKPEITDDDIEVLQSKLVSVREQIVSDSIDFQTAVREYSSDEASIPYNGAILDPNTGSNVHMMDEMDSELYFAIEGLKEGDVSEPMKMRLYDGSEAYRLIYLVRRTKPHVANLNDDYSRIMEVALQQEQDKAMGDWVQEKVQKTYVRVKTSSEECPVLNKWKK